MPTIRGAESPDCATMQFVVNTTAVGHFEKQAAFVTRHAEFFERFPRLMAAVNDAFNRTLNAAGSLDPIIFYLGSRTVDDFEAILILASNGLALPAQATLRGMYERVVTTAHLHDNPDEITDFLDFDVLHRRRTALAFRDTVGLEPEQAAAMPDLESEYQRVKGRFEIACGCGKRRPRPGWSKVDFVTMAKKQKGLDGYLGPAYYRPLEQVHSTFRSASALIELRDGSVCYRGEHRELADEVFRIAYALLLNALGIQAGHFNLPNLNASLLAAIQDHMDLYPEDEDADRAGQSGA